MGKRGKLLTANQLVTFAEREEKSTAEDLQPSRLFGIITKCFYRDINHLSRQLLNI